MKITFKFILNAVLIILVVFTLNSCYIYDHKLPKDTIKKIPTEPLKQTDNKYFVKNDKFSLEFQVKTNLKKGDKVDYKLKLTNLSNKSFKAVKSPELIYIFLYPKGEDPNYIILNTEKKYKFTKNEVIDETSPEVSVYPSLENLPIGEYYIDVIARFYEESTIDDYSLVIEKILITVE